MSALDETCGPVLILGAGGMLGHALMDRFRTRFRREADKRVVGWDIEDMCLEALGGARPWRTMQH